ncbi:MAG: hypothetical protein ACXVBG_25350 [Isosphaeraceae bacterium]
MLKALGSRLTYANVMATFAVFLALGGGAYALSGIPDRSGVYHGCADPKTGALRVVKSASSCRKTKTVIRAKRRVRIPGELAVSWNQQGPRGLQGIQGQQGNPGTPGAAGASATKLFAFIRDAGGATAPVVQYGSGVTGVSDTTVTGIYNVTFDRSLDNCVVTAQPGGGAPSGGTSVVDSTEFASTVMSAGSGVVTVSFSKSGAAADDTSFFITAFC